MTNDEKRPLTLEGRIILLESKISRLEKFVILAIITNLPQLLEIFKI